MSNYESATFYRPGVIALVLFLSLFPPLLTVHRAGDVTIIDSWHYSQVFGEVRNYRIFLPPGYFQDSTCRYPVIYFYHGWSQRYFGSINTPGADQGDSNEGDNIENFVSGNDVIVVRPDGYNRRRGEDYYRRPYNIGPVETFRQFPVYFPELVDHIDSRYRTLASREKRAISGLSMGGFMTFWIAGMYPHMVSAAGNFCGSPEFVVGPVDFPVEYRHIDMAGNYGGVNVRLNYGNEDFIRDYHLDMNRYWTQLMDNYQYRIYEAGHTTCGLGEMFGFIMNTFRNPPKKPERWNHINVYPDFGIWDYRVRSDRDLPGFTVLENVDREGFRISVREFLPDGGLMPFVNLTVKTGPLYEKDQSYVVNIIDMQDLSAERKVAKSDNEGRLEISLNGSMNEVAIKTMDGSPVLCIGDVVVDNMARAEPGSEVALRIGLLNKGFGRAGNVRARLTPATATADVFQGEVAYGDIEVNSMTKGDGTFTFIVRPDTVVVERFRLVINDENNREWTGYFEVPVRNAGFEIKNYVIADGSEFTVAAAGTDSVTAVFGSGNGDGVVNPGESVVILAKDEGKLWRTELYTSDKYVNPGNINIRKSDNWGRYDHVGGSAKYSVPVISSDCPDGHQIEFFATYWLPDYPEHIIKQGKVTITVEGKDKTPPLIRRVKVDGDNTVSVMALDGSEIRQVSVRFTEKNDPQRVIEAVLNDQGRDGDRYAGDMVFSKTIPESGFGLFQAEIIARDSHGNESVTVWDDEIFVLF